MRYQPEIWYIDNLSYGEFKYEKKIFLRGL